MNFQDLARPEVVAMKAYESARNSAGDDGVLLNANEAPDSLIEDPAWASLKINRYPNPQPHELLARLADLYGVDIERLLVTRGSDEGIDLLLRVFCRAGHDAIIECPPCFGMYRIAAQIQGAKVIQVDRNAQTLRPDIDQLVKTISGTEGLKLVFLTSPNNPTGETLALGELKRILNASRSRALVIMDEAYIEFCPGGMDAENTAVSLLDSYPNLVVLRTLSKAWAAAGLRCGAVMAHPDVISLLGRVMAPYPLTAPAVAVALAITDEPARERQEQMLANIDHNKRVLVSFLEQHSWVHQQWHGEANFVLVRVNDAPALVQHCASMGVRIRDFSQQPMLENCVRFSIGNNKDMQALNAALDTYGAVA